MKDRFNRRDFFKRSAGGGAALVLSGLAEAEDGKQKRLGRARPAPVAKPLERVRIGYVGVGGMGTAHVQNLIRIPGAEIRAVCDIIEERARRAQNLVEQAGQPRPEAYTRGEFDFKRLCARDDLDLVYTATPWEWHVPVCLEALHAGKHAATEVPAATSIADCWRLVEASERSGLYCLMMENCVYDRIEMLILNMVRKGLFGELLHAECGYLHDLRRVKYDMEGEGKWRRAHSQKRNGDLYPTHGLGPVSQYLEINRGNRFDFLVSSGTKTRGLHLFAVNAFGPDSPQARESFKLSDIVITLLHTHRGETVILKHDTNSPRPYSRDILVQGTRGIVRKYPDARVYIEGRSPEDRWEPLDAYLKDFSHPVWTELEERSKGAGHGGMDFIEDYRLIQALQKGIAPDSDVYDAAMLSAVSELSARSIAMKGRPVDFPDFTRGLWRQPRELHVENQATIQPMGAATAP